MVAVGKARLFRRKDDKYLIYVPKDFAEDSMFPLKIDPPASSRPVRISFEKNKVIIEEWKD